MGATQSVLSTMTYNTQHDPLTMTYNAVGQILTRTNASKKRRRWLASVSSPIAGSSTAAVVYAHDQLGRVTSRGVDAAGTNGNNVATTLDDLGRVTIVSHALGSFGTPTSPLPVGSPK